jgi:hypothetical protein
MLDEKLDKKLDEKFRQQNQQNLANLENMLNKKFPNMIARGIPEEHHNTLSHTRKKILAQDYLATHKPLRVCTSIDQWIITYGIIISRWN